jgi:hypothetical protein
MGIFGNTVRYNWQIFSGEQARTPAALKILSCHSDKFMIPVLFGRPKFLRFVYKIYKLKLLVFFQCIEYRVHRIKEKKYCKLLMPQHYDIQTIFVERSFNIP